jgi:FkbM family methyltransferase
MVGCFSLLSQASIYWDGSMDLMNSSSQSDTGCANHIVNLHHLSLPKYTQCLRQSNTDILSKFVRQHGSWEECNPLQHLWKQSNTHRSPISRNNSVFVDVGGNIGSCSLLMAAMGVNVLSFEPLPSNLFYFTRSIKLNVATGLFPSNLIKLYPLGVGNITQSVTMYSQPINPGNSVVNLTVPEYDSPGNYKVMHDNNFTINIIRLDDILWPDRSIPPPQIDLMKVALYS